MTIIDVGVNIGNHSLYWCSNKNPKKIFCFEAVRSTYEILCKNIYENNLSDIMIPFNIGASDSIGRGLIKRYDHKNIGATAIKKDPHGRIELAPLDSFDCILSNKIDLIKIDVEGF